MLKFCAEVLITSYLGILILKHSATKLCCTVRFLKRNTYNLPMYLCEHSYKQIILPMLDYCSSIWDPYHHNAINQIEMIQHRAARFVTNKPWRRDRRDSITAILHELNWPTLQDRRKNNRLMLFFKLVNNLLVVPHHYLPLPSFPVTRANHQLKFSHYQARTETYRNSFFPKTTIDWNHLPYPDLHEIDLETFRLYLFN